MNMPRPSRPCWCMRAPIKTCSSQWPAPVNEPDITYSGINLTGSTQYVTVMHDLAVQLNNNGMTNVLFSGPDLANTSTNWLAQIMADPLIMSKLAHFGLHSYQNQSADATGVYNFIQQSPYPNTHFWMTEYNVWCASCQSETDGAGNNTWAYARGTATFLLDLLGEGASAGIVWEGYDSEYTDFNAFHRRQQPVSLELLGIVRSEQRQREPPDLHSAPGFLHAGANRPLCPPRRATHQRKQFVLAA